MGGAATWPFPTLWSWPTGRGVLGSRFTPTPHRRQIGPRSDPFEATPFTSEANDGAVVVMEPSLMSALAWACIVPLREGESVGEWEGNHHFLGAVK